MFYPKGQSTRYETIGGLNCRVPKPPKNPAKIRGSHLPKKDQKWYREGLPDITAREIEFFTDDALEYKPDQLLSWEVARRQELIKQTGFDPWDSDRNAKPVPGVIPDINYVNPTLHAFRVQEFQRCYPWTFDEDGKEVENGLWFMNHGEPVYLTPFHYFYLEWWHLNTGYPFYRDTDRQKFYFWQYCFEDPKCYGYMEVDKRGGGKCLEINELVRVYNKGVKKAGDIQVGDVLVGDDEEPRVVVDSYRGRSEKSYLIVPHRGEPHRVNEDHILALYYNAITGNRRTGWKPKSYVSMTVKEYLACTKTEKEHLVLYRRGWGKQWPKLENPIIPPYLLGVWLGDGTALDGGITNSDEPIRDYIHSYAESIDYKVSKPDKRLMKIVMPYRNGNDTNTFRQELRELNILNNKHIPEKYLYSSREDRMELLAGILDTDGSLHNNCFEITQKLKRLSYQIVELARSLDFYVSINKKLAKMKREDGSIYECLVYRIMISGNTDLIPNKVERKKAKPRKQLKNHRNTGFKVIEEGPIEYQGISVTDNKLFLLEDGTVTHNTYRSTSVLYQRTIYGRETHSGIQSKTDDDAAEIFNEKLVKPYQKLPDFWRPVNKSGTTPSGKIEFMVKSVRSKNAMYQMAEQQMALNTLLDFRSSSEVAYDGANVTGILLRDEEGKCESRVCDVSARHEVTKASVFRDDRIFGKIYSTTTVEEMEKGGANYEKIFMDSDPLQRNDIGETKSGLYRLFMPAYETSKFDEYGVPVVDDPPRGRHVYNQATGKPITVGARTEQEARRKQYRGEPKKYLRYCLKFPWTIEELFYSTGEGCPFNVMVLEECEMHYKLHGKGTLDQMKDPGWLEKPVFGDFIWKDGKPFTEAIFVEEVESNAKWCVSYLFPESRSRDENHANNVVQKKYIDKVYRTPKNTDEFFGGFDPTKSHATTEKRRSKAGGSIFRKEQFWDKEETGVHGTWVADFIWEPDDPLMQYDHFLIGLWYYGAQVLLENNIPTMLDRYGQIGCYDIDDPDAHFISWRWAEISTSKSQLTPGLPSNVETNNQLLQKTQSHIHHSGHLLRLPRLIKDLKEYREATRTKHDLSVAAQLALMASTKPIKKKQERVELQSLFRRYNG